MTFGLRILKLIEALPRSAAGRAVATQLVSCGTAVGANYRAACRSRSRKEFIARLGVVEEEADESAYWLELIIAAHLLQPRRVQALLDEAQALLRIIAASRITAQRNLKKRNPDSPN